MKRFLIACSMALSLTAISNQKASAWSKFNFNVGLNISRESAENNFLWGAYRNGPHPFAQGGGYGGVYGYGNAGGAGTPYYNPMPATAGSAPATLPAPVQSTPVQSLPSASSQTRPVMYNANQQIGYSWPSNSYYAPYYWYGK